jgi:hypothetical protein
MKAAVHNWLCTQPKSFILMPLNGLLTDGQHVWRNRESMLSNNIFLMSERQTKFSGKECGHFLKIPHIYLTFISKFSK